MQPALRLREKLARKELTTGILITEHVWPDLVEISKRAGLDYVIVDLEHGPHSPDVVAEACATGRRLDFPVFIRPLANDYSTIRHCADLGPCGFLLASVETAAELDVVRDALYLPPRGRRRPGGMSNRWVSDFTQPTWQATVEEKFIVLPQVETRTGFKNAQAIASHELTTALAVGPYDLSAELGVCGLMDAPVLREHLFELRKIADAAGKMMWMIGGNAEKLTRDGWRFLCIGEPCNVLEVTLRDRVATARRVIGEMDGKPSSDPRYA